MPVFKFDSHIGNYLIYTMAYLNINLHLLLLLCHVRHVNKVVTEILNRYAPIREMNLVQMLFGLMPDFLRSNDLIIELW